MRKRKSSIYTKISRPFLAVLVLIIGMFAVTVRSSVLSYLRQAADNMFQKQVEGRQMYLQNMMEKPCLCLNNSLAEITAEIERTVLEEGLKTDDIYANAELNQKILLNLTDTMLRALRSAGSTEIFLILDGPGSVSFPDITGKAGIYIRNRDPNFFSSSNQDLLFERGLPQISKKWQLSLDRFWKASFTFNYGEEGDFFSRPLAAARKGGSSNPSDFSYWSYGCPVDAADRGILMCSVPLLMPDGEVVGVAGVGFAEDYFKQYMDYRELGSDGMGAYLLAKTEDGVTYDVFLQNGHSYGEHVFLENKLLLEGKSGEVHADLGGQDMNGLCAIVSPLSLYSSNTPFVKDQWALLGIRREKELYSLVGEAQRQIFWISIVALILSFLCALWITQRIAGPIRSLADDVRRSDPSRTVHLQRLEVEEIDELVGSIERLSADVAEAFSKISRILQMSGAKVGVFEYKENEKQAYFSTTLCELAQWPATEEENSYMDAEEFRERFEELRKHQSPDDENLLELEENGEKRYLRVRLKRGEESVLGVLTDVTHEVQEKHKIEYERDYDVLTNIWNRRAFEEKVRKLFKSPEKLKTAALIMWDLDNLKFVNDTYGHTAGDAYIIALADCLRASERSGIFSARRSGDEFVTFLFGEDTEEEIRELIDGIWERVVGTHLHLPGGKEYRIRVSAGAAWYPRDAEDEETLFRYADFAMYTAKHSTKGRLAYFDELVFRQDRLLLQGQEAFNNLLDNRLVRYALQPIVNVHDGSIYGYEMLMRPELSEIQSPADIMRLAHAQSKLYDVEVLTWLEAMRTYANLVEYHLVDRRSRVFINSISNQLLKPEVVELIQETFAPYLSQVVCEFTEEEQGNLEITGAKAELVRSWKGQVALDDYGCGYNSETVLLDLSPDIVKVDMEIVRGIDRDESRQYLVRSLVQYAHARKILVLGEGVETRTEMEMLVRLGVDLLQGFYLARPSFDAHSPEPSVINEMLTERRKRI